MTALKGLTMTAVTGLRGSRQRPDVTDQTLARGPTQEVVDGLTRFYSLTPLVHFAGMLGL